MKLIPFLLCSFFLVSVQNVSRAAIVFTDDFSSDPMTNGWAESISAVDTATGIIDSDGSSAVLRKTGGSDRLTLTISRTVSSVGFEDLLVDFTAFQSLTGYESDDFIRIEYNSGSGFVTLLQDNEVWTGSDNLAGDGTTGDDGNITPTSISTIALGADADENASLQFRLTADLNATNEDVFFDSFTISGTATAVPEPSSLAVLGILGLGIARTNMRTRRFACRGGSKPQK